MADLTTRQDWEQEFDLLAQEGTLTSALASARRPNKADTHDAAAHIDRARTKAPLIVSTLLKASALVTSQRA